MSFEYYNLEETRRFPMGPLEIDVPALYEQFPVAKDGDARLNYVPLFDDRFHRALYSNRLLPLRYRIRFRQLLRKIGLDDLWLGHFGPYWLRLGGRPLWHPSDFFFLRNFYRLRQRPPTLNQIMDVAAHLEAWQDPAYIYVLFQAVLNEAFLSQELYAEIARKFFPNASSILEFGSGLAPITTSLLEFKCLPENAQFLLADLPTLTFHYAGYKFRKCSNVEQTILTPEQNFELHTERTFDVIFCCQVFEHLNDPLGTVKRFHQNLKPGGVLVFDYIKSEGRGLDSLQGLEEREAVLGFITDTFRLEYGRIEMTDHMGLTVARKLS